MTISLCAALMNFLMQITHLNQERSPVPFVFRQQRHPENQRNKSASVYLAINRSCCIFLLQQSVWSSGGKGAAVQTKQLKKQSHTLGIQNDANSFAPDHSEQKKFLRLLESEWVWEQHELTGDDFLWAQHLYLLHLYVISHSSSSQTMALFLFFSSSEPWQASGRFGRGTERRRGERLYGSAALRMKFMNTGLVSCAWQVTEQRHKRAVPLHHPTSQVAEEKGCCETEQWAAGLHFCPGAISTGTNQYYISMSTLYGYNYLCDCLSCSLPFSLSHSYAHAHTLTQAFNDSYLIGKGASRRGQTWPGWCVDVHGASKCSWMVLMRVENGDIKREWVHFSL